jgi:formylglycine-generating enzyme required for sulfatase activity
VTGYAFTLLACCLLAPLCGVEALGREEELTLPQGITPISSTEFLNTSDGSVLILVREPDLAFLTRRSLGKSPLIPSQHLAGSFLIGKTEVSNSQFVRFRQAMGRALDPAMRRQDLPVVGLGSAEILEYCNWASARLPTQAEWEYSACGFDSNPWGGQRPSRALVNGADRASRLNAVDPWTDGFARLAPVHSFERGSSPFGILHAFGNAAELVYLYGPTAEAEELCVVGGSCMDRFGDGTDRRDDSRPYRGPDAATGFRVCRSLRSSPEPDL